MMRSLSSAVAGLRTHQIKMDVIGNNIANVNTYGYKTSRATFSDVYYQTISGGRASDGQRGGMNPTQVGYGSKLATIDKIMSNGGGAYTGRPHDVYIDGDGFFVVQDASGGFMYTRMGNFTVIDGYMVDYAGNFVMGIPMNEPAGYKTGEVSQSSGDFWASTDLTRVYLQDARSGTFDTKLAANNPLRPDLYPNLPAPHANYVKEHAAVWGKGERPDGYQGGVWPMTFLEFIQAKKDQVIDPAVLQAFETAKQNLESEKYVYDGLNVQFQDALGKYDNALKDLDSKNQALIAANAKEMALGILNGIIVGPPSIETALINARDGIGIGNMGGTPYTVAGFLDGTLETDFETARDALLAAVPVDNDAIAALTAEYNAARQLGQLIRNAFSLPILQAQQGVAANISEYNAAVNEKNNAMAAQIAAQELAIANAEALWAIRQQLFAPAGNVGDSPTAGDFQPTVDSFAISNYPAGRLTMSSSAIRSIMNTDANGWGPELLTLATAANTQNPLSDPPDLDLNSVYGAYMQAAADFAVAQAAYNNEVSGSTNPEMLMILELEKILSEHKINLPGDWGSEDWTTVSNENGVLTNLANIMEARGYSAASGLYQWLYTFFNPNSPENQAIGGGWVDSYEKSNGLPPDAKGHPRYNAVDHAGWTDPIGPNDPNFVFQWENASSDLKGVYDCVTSITVGSDGSIYGITNSDLEYPAGSGNYIAKNQPIYLGKLAVATFTNQDGLDQVGDSFYLNSTSSGEARYTTADTNGSGRTLSGYLEMANVEISQQFTDMITTQRGFQANTRIVTVSDEMLQELVNMKR